MAAEKFSTDDGHGFECDECEFTSSGWGTKKQRDERLAQHREEHETGEAMPELAVFRGDVQG